jgi:hypothetical protein
MMIDLAMSLLHYKFCIYFCNFVFAGTEHIINRKKENAEKCIEKDASLKTL